LVLGGILVGLALAAGLVSAAALQAGALLEHHHTINVLHRDVYQTVGGWLWPYTHVSDPGGGLVLAARSQAPGKTMWLAMVSLCWLLLVGVAFAVLTAVGRHRGRRRKKGGMASAQEVRRTLSRKAIASSVAPLHRPAGDGKRDPKAWAYEEDDQ
jgi:hypothetical protein